MNKTRYTSKNLREQTDKPGWVNNIRSDKRVKCSSSTVGRDERGISGVASTLKESSQSTESGDKGSHTVETEDDVTIHQSVVGSTDDGGSRRGARRRGRFSGWLRSGIGRGGILGRSQAGVVVAWLYSDRTTPTLLVVSIQNGDHNFSASRDGDGPLDCVGINLAKVGKFVATGIASGNDNDIIRTIGVIPVKGRGLALGEHGSVNRKVCSDMENGESEKEGSGKKSGVHRRDNFQTLRTRGR